MPIGRIIIEYLLEAQPPVFVRVVIIEDSLLIHDSRVFIAFRSIIRLEFLSRQFAISIDVRQSE